MWRTFMLVAGFNFPPLLPLFPPSSLEPLEFLDLFLGAIVEEERGAKVQLGGAAICGIDTDFAFDKFLTRLLPVALFD